MTRIYCLAFGAAIVPVSAGLASFGLRLSNWFERWFPDAFALALTAVVIVFAAAETQRTNA